MHIEHKVRLREVAQAGRRGAFLSGRAESRIMSAVGPAICIAGARDQAYRQPNRSVSGARPDEAVVPGHLGRAGPRRRRPRLRHARSGRVLRGVDSYRPNEAVLAATRRGPSRYALLTAATCAALDQLQREAIAELTSIRPRGGTFDPVGECCWSIALALTGFACPAQESGHWSVTSSRSRIETPPLRTIWPSTILLCVKRKRSAGTA